MHMTDMPDMQYDIHKWAKERGWWDRPRDFGELMMLITTEVAEAYEEYRNDHEPKEVYHSTDKYGGQKPEGVPTELADIVIRVMDICEFYNINLYNEIRNKMEYNRTRPYRHGGKRA
jgi:NTP pyrophosphatase (non-canonical NTP hydrolase)